MTNPIAPESPRWPTASMLGWGMLGVHDAAGRRYRTRASIALFAFCVGVIVSGALDLRPVTAVVPGLAFFYIAYEFRRYLSAVDELARRLLLESIAWTYLCAGVVLMFAAGIILAYDLHPHPIWAFVGLATVEAIRGPALYFVSRRYQ